MPSWWPETEARSHRVIADYEQAATGVHPHIEKHGITLVSWKDNGRARRSMRVAPPGFDHELALVSFQATDHTTRTKFDRHFPPGLYLQCSPRLTGHLREISPMYEVLHDTRLVTRTGKIDTDEGDLCKGGSVPEMITTCCRFLDDVARAAEMAPAQELRQTLLDFKRTYNDCWRLERLGYRTPAQARRDFLARQEQAA